MIDITSCRHGWNGRYGPAARSAGCHTRSGSSHWSPCRTTPTPTSQEEDGSEFTERFARGAFDGMESRTPGIHANRDHDRTRPVGKAHKLYTHRREGLVADIKISRDAARRRNARPGRRPGAAFVDQVRRLPEGHRIRQTVAAKRTIRRAFLDHIAFVTEPAYATANVLAVRNRHPSAAGSRRRRCSTRSLPAGPTTNYDPATTSSTARSASQQAPSVAPGWPADLRGCLHTRHWEISAMGATAIEDSYADLQAKIEECIRHQNTIVGDARAAEPGSHRHRSRDRQVEDRADQGLPGPGRTADRPDLPSPPTVRQRSEELSQALALVRRPEMAGFQYRSAGHYVLDNARAIRGDREARDRIDWYNRVAAHQTTTNAAGVVPQEIVGSVINFIDSSRPLVTALGVRPLEGGPNFFRPRVTTHTSGGEAVRRESRVLARRRWCSTS